MPDRSPYNASSAPESLPAFRLHSDHLEMVGPEDYRQRRNLVLVFVDGPRCAVSGPLINDLVSHYKEIRRLNAEVLAVLSLKGGLEVLQSGYRSCFSLLFDPDERAASKCLGAGTLKRPAVIVADRCGTVWERRVGGDSGEAIEVDEIVEELRFIQMQCPDCGGPDEPPSSP